MGDHAPQQPDIPRILLLPSHLAESCNLDFCIWYGLFHITGAVSLTRKCDRNHDLAAHIATEDEGGRPYATPASYGSHRGACHFPRNPRDHLEQVRS